MITIFPLPFGEGQGGVSYFNFKFYFASLRLPYPIPLLYFYSFWVINQIQISVQSIRIFCNSQHPLLFLSLFRIASATFAFSIYHFFICQTYLTGKTPVYMGFRFICQTFFKKLQKYPLRPFIIIWVSSIYFPRPIKRKTERFQLFSEYICVFLSDNCRFLFCFNGIIFSRQTKGVPTDGI